MTQEDSGTRGKQIALVAGPLLGAALGTFLFLGPQLPAAACFCAAITIVCAVWWVTEPIPIPATSLIPFATFPLVGVLTHKEVATAYGHHLILLLLGGFILSTAMEKSGAHLRLALGMVRLFGGGGGKGLVLGFMVAAAVLSMWISNTATTLMLLPVILAVVDQSEDKNLGVALLLGVAYAASVGGMGTPVGTPPNVIFMGAYDEIVGKEISFLEWMKIGLPVVFVMIPIIWLWLTRKLGKGQKLDLPHPGKLRSAEVRVLSIFFITAVAWVTRTEPFGGWSKLLGATGSAGDSTVALFAVVVLFIVPDGEGGRLLNWKTAAKIPWGLLLLFGGGIAIAKAFGKSGLSEALGQALAGLANWPVLAMIFVLCLGITFLTEITSNTATTALLMPILAEAGLASGIDPLLLMVPATISASCAFMLPVATAPNAIVFGTNRFPIKTMMREGLALNLIGVVVVTTVCFFMLR